MKNLLNIRIKTSRLLLLPITMKYKEDIFREFTEDIATYMNPEPAKNINETEEFIDKSIRGLKRRDNLQLVILNKVTKEFLGCIGLHHLDKRILTLGIWLKKSAHGHKYGQEAMKAIKKWADENINYHYLTYIVAEDNIASEKIAIILGGRKIREYNEEKYHCFEYRIYPKKR